jgi:hypothetical protein
MIRSHLVIFDSIVRSLILVFFKIQRFLTYHKYGARRAFLLDMFVIPAILAITVTVCAYDRLLRGEKSHLSHFISHQSAHIFLIFCLRLSLTVVISENIQSVFVVLL